MNTESNTTLNDKFDLLKNEKYQQDLAVQADQILFPNEQAKKNTAQIVNAFVDDYLINGRNQPINQWLIQRFQQYPDIWESEEELKEIAETIISTIDNLASNQVYIEAQITKGKSLANIFNRKIEEVAQTHNINASEIQQDIDHALQTGNRQHTELYTQQAVDLLPEMANSGLEGTRQITEKLKLNANLNLAWHGAKSIGSRLFNSLTGKENLTRQQELTRIIRSAVDSAENKGIQIAVSGGMVVSAKKGWVKGVFDTVEKIENAIERTRETISRVQDLALNVADGWNDLRLLDQVERGALLAIDVAAEKAKFTAAKTITKIEQNAKNWLRQKGGALGAKAGALLGSILGPAGTAFGGAVGGFLGEKAGKWVGDKIVTPVADLARKVADKAIDTVKDVAKNVVSKVSEGVKSVGRALSRLKFW